MNKELEKTLRYAHEVKRGNDKIRIYMKNGIPFFAIADIVKASGIKTPTNWVRRSIANEPYIKCTRILYPKETIGGIKRFNVLFVTAEEAKRVMRCLPIFGETRKWLLEEVLTFGQPTCSHGTKSVPAAQKRNFPSQYPGLNEIYGDRIDALIVDLLEIRNQLRGNEKFV